MIYPVNNFKEDWYDAQPFGRQTNYGFHEGCDLNLKTGGDTDLGQELKSIAKGRIVYYHYASHPTYGFGRHLVVRIEGDWGTRWVHYAHCDINDFKTVQDVAEGQVIARLGKSGTPYAHLHFSIFKVDPATIGGIDVIARTQEQLNAWWEDPIAFIEKWIAPQPTPTPPAMGTDQTKYDFGENYGVMELQAAKSVIQAQKSRVADLESKMATIKAIIG